MSTKKRPGDTELRGMLLEGHFGTPRELRPADPVAPTHLHLEIDRIKPYEHNPRRLRNPLYPRIKASIRAKRGLDDPIGITSRPGDALYTVRAGGNTRLSILKELWQETRDTAFSRTYCLFVPWTSESDCITAHLIENELRGELAFIDKAIALKGLLEQLEEEVGASLPRSEFVRRLAEISYPISRRQMIRYEYAAQVLENLIPEALEEGLGGRQIDEIREAEKHYLEYWKSCGLDVKEFDRLFRYTLSKHDSDGWNLRLALDELEMRISEKTGKPFKPVRLEVDVWIAGIQPHSLAGEDPPVPEAMDATLPPGPPEPPDESLHSEESGTTNSDSGGARTELGRITQTTHETEETEEAVTLPGMNSDHGSTPDGTDRHKTNAARTDGAGRPSPATQPSDHPEVDLPALDEDEPATPFLSSELNTARDKQPSANDLKSLRSRACVLATRFAQSFYCERQIRPASQGYGFFVEMPNRPIRDDEVAWWGWWMLFSLSEQAITKARLKLAPSGMRLPKFLIEDRLDDALVLTGHPPDAIHTLGHAFLSSPLLSERAFRDLLTLIETCRILRNGFPEEKLWLCPTIDQLKKGDRR
ncbi:MAG: ParB family protein [Blastocatellia bacterium]